MMYDVFCLDTAGHFYFDAKSPFDALYKMLYTLNLQKEDRTAIIKASKTGKTLNFVHHGQTYSVINQIVKGR